MLYSGIDLHTRSLVIHTLDADSTGVREAELAARREAVATYFAALPGPHRPAVECVRSWCWLRDLLAPMAPYAGTTLVPAIRRPHARTPVNWARLTCGRLAAAV